MFNIGPQELLVILVIALIVVGPHRLPALGRSIGRGLREIRKAQDDVRKTIQVELDEDGRDGEPRPSRPTGGRRPNDPETQPTETPPAKAGTDRAPSASEPLPASEVREISRTLGRSLAEIRRAREEVTRSFRIDLTEPIRPARRKTDGKAKREEPKREEPPSPPPDAPAD